MELRAIYDKHGEYGLKEGLIVEGKRVGGGYFLKRTPEQVFDSVFNAVDPWKDQPNMDGSDLRGGIFGDGFKGAGNPGAPAPKDVVVTVSCTL